MGKLMTWLLAFILTLAAGAAGVFDASNPTSLKELTRFVRRQYMRLYDLSRSFRLVARSWTSKLTRKFSYRLWWLYFAYRTWKRGMSFTVLPVAGGQTNYPNGITSRGMPTESILSKGDVYHVDSGHTNADDNNAGKNPKHPLKTIDAAIGKCTASNGDLILVSEGHVEDLAAAGEIDADVAGISIIGLGRGPSRPRIDFNATDAKFTIGASGVGIYNLTFRPSVALVVVGINIETTATDTVIKDCEALPGEAGDGTDEFVDFIVVNSTCTRTWIDGLLYSHHASADGAQTAISVVGASDRVRVSNFWIEGSGTAWVAGIQGITTLSTRMLIEKGYITCDAEPGIELLTGTTGIIKDVTIFSDLATIDAATVADGMAHDNVKYIEVGNEADTQVKTPSVDD